MPRNKTFKSRPPPFSGDENLELDHSTVNGPLPFFNPTNARYQVKTSAQKDSHSPGAAAEAAPGATSHVPGVEARWRARDNRKGRHPIILHPSEQQGKATHPSTFRTILKGLRRMATECPYWDVSYLVSVFFSVGCLIFIASGLLYWLPLVAPETEFSGETTIVGGITSFLGATLFQIGAVLLVFEACNENQTGCFGWALHRAIHGDAADKEAGHQPGTQAQKDPDSCKHHHGRGENSEPLRQPRPGRRWSWWPSWVELKTHYFHEIGFVASMTLVVGASIFYISGICSLPGIYENMSLGVARGVYWLTYLVGGVLFIISSVLYMLENQPNWYTPAPHLIGWHIGLWNLIGSIGWTLAASLGYCTASWCEYQGELTLIWASTSFLIGSALQWYESLDKYPVEKNGRSS